MSYRSFEYNPDDPDTKYVLEYFNRFDTNKD